MDTVVFKNKFQRALLSWSYSLQVMEGKYL
jgi:hypothetical protein